MANNIDVAMLESLVGHRLTINAKPNRATVTPQRPPIDSSRDPNNPFMKPMVFQNSNQNPSHSSNPFHSFNMNPKISGQSICRCDPEFVNFCKIHAISHSDCAVSRQVCCQLCSTAADFKSIQWHLSSEKHKTRHVQLMEYVFLLSIPDYSRFQSIKITDLLEHLYENASLSKQDYERRVQVVNHLNEILRTNGLEGYMLRAYGSTITRTETNNGFALKQSDLNLDIVCRDIDNSDKTINALALTLAKISELIQNRPEFNCIKNEFNLKKPKLRFRLASDDYNDFEIEVTIMCEKRYRLSKLLQQYCEIDDRVSKLGMAFREWARIYGFDDQENGLWPSFTFPVLAIHYLQHCDPPVLPCLHELLANSQTPNTSGESQPTTSAKVILDDNETVEDFFNLKGLKWEKLNNKSVGELWLDMLRYYAVEFDTESRVVSIRTTKPVQTSGDKHWSTRMMAVEDPANPSLNLSRSVGTMRLYNTFIEQLRHTYKYFWIPFITTNLYSHNNQNALKVKPLFTERDFEVLVNQNHRYDNLDLNDMPNQSNQIHNNSNESQPKSQNHNQKGSDDSDTDDESKKKDNFHLKANKILKTFGIWMELNPDLQRTAQLIPPNQLSYTFALQRMPFYQRPQKFCRLCHRYGHLQNFCPEQELPKLKDLPEVLSPLLDMNLCNIFENIFTEKGMNENDVRIQDNILNDLEYFIREVFPKAKLDLFGSTRNGFGARHCDLDICLTFEDNPTGEGLELQKILERVIELLESHERLVSIQGITTAKVPIVKFKYIYDRNTTVECDISMYNILAVHNTQLLSTYTKIDKRVQILGFIVKHFAKICDMCDASRGSLSSYAYTLMTIHYLQQKSILPVLQEIALDLKEERTVEGWDTWFFSDLDNLKKYWNPYPNDESVAQLFFGFLRYYSEIFDFDQYVICCRQMSPLKRLEKMWTGYRVAIEDPFLLTHNLGAGVSAQMAVFIKTSLIKGRNHFGSEPTTELDRNRYKDWSEYFFNRQFLTNGLPPTGRGCRICGKIGHKQNQCPQKKGRQRQNSDRHERQDMNDRTDKNFHNRMERNVRQERNRREDGFEMHENYDRKDRIERSNQFERHERQERRVDRPFDRPMDRQIDRPQVRTDRPERPHSMDKKQNPRRKPNNYMK